MKVYEVCESRSGYITYIQSYELHYRLPGMRARNESPTLVVSRPADALKDQGYTLFKDKLLQLSITTRCSRSNGQHDRWSSAREQGGNACGRQRYASGPWGSFLVASGCSGHKNNVKWQEKQEVNIFSTKHLANFVEVHSAAEQKMKPFTVQ